MTTPGPFITTGQLALTDDDAVSAASGIIRTYCGWHIYPSLTFTLTMDGKGGEFFFLPSKYVTAVTALSVTDSDGTVTALVDGTDYQWNQQGVLERISLNGYGTTCWPWTLQSVTVSFTHGYDTPPDEITALCQSIAKRWPSFASAWDSKRLGSASLSAGANAKFGDLTPLEAMVLSRYKVHGQA